MFYLTFAKPIIFNYVLLDIGDAYNYELSIMNYEL